MQHMQDPQKVYSTWMTKYLTKKQKAALCHRAYPEPIRREPGDEVQWKYQISCQSKSQKANGEITIQKIVIGNHNSHGLARSHNSHTTPAHM
jgi:hypothetical protein